MLSKVTFACFLAIAVVICETKTPVRKCSGDLPLPLSVQIENCEELPCTVTKGTTATMDVQFVAVQDETHYIEAEVHATVFGMVLPYPLPSDTGNVCNHLLYGAYCPLYATEDVVYHMDFPVENTFPEISAKCEVKLMDKDKNIISCFVADLKIRKSPKADQLL